MSAQKHAVEEPLSLYPDNPHYFLFRGKPTVLVTSAEHYGAVLNREFDTDKYLAELHKHGLNLTRTFTSTRRRRPGAVTRASAARLTFSKSSSRDSTTSA